MGGEFMVLDWGEIRLFAVVSFTKRSSAAKAATRFNVIYGTYSTSLRAAPEGVPLSKTLKLTRHGFPYDNSLWEQSSPFRRKQRKQRRGNDG
jgi:hypothetical protein